MTEIRYIKIIKCLQCGYHEHTYDARIEKITTHFCTNPENMKLEQIPSKKVGEEIYPIIAEDKNPDLSIPFWCNLPNTVNRK